MKTNFVMFRTPPTGKEYKINIIDNSIDRRDQVTTLDIMTDPMSGAPIYIKHLPKAGMFALGSKLFRYGSRHDFDLFHFMHTYAISKTNPPADPIPFCKPILAPGCKIAHSFQINNFIFVMRKVTDMPFANVLMLPLEERANLCNMRLEIRELVPQGFRDHEADLPPVSLANPRPLPTKVSYSIHNHGYVHLIMQHSVHHTVKKLQGFWHRAAFKRRCLRRKALLAVCMASHDRLGAQATSGVAKLMEDPNDCIMRAIIAPMLFPPRKKMRV